MKQRWECDTCKAKGDVIYVDGHGAWSVMTDITDDHAKLSPFCTTGSKYIKVFADIEEDVVE